MERKIRVGAVSYLNTLPLVYGFNSSEIQQQSHIIFDYPAKIAARLLNDEIDIGLVPVAVIPQLNEAHIISDYCIGATKPVASVCLFSDVPIHKVRLVYTDYQSRTSAALLQILFKEYWKVAPDILPSFPGYENSVSGTTAGLIIGDRALEALGKYQYVYDLAEAWIALTGLPFVFAAWVANKKMEDSFVSLFNKATGKGLHHIPEIVSKHSFAHYDLVKYYTENIDYFIDNDKKKGMALFLDKLRYLK